jgi:hypothetical protein
MGHKIRNLWNIRHRVNGYHLSLFLNIEPADNNNEKYNIEYLQNIRVQIRLLTKSKIIYSNARDVKRTSIPRGMAHTARDAWKVANHTVPEIYLTYGRYNQQRAYTVGNRIRLATEAATSIKKSYDQDLHHPYQ